MSFGLASGSLIAAAYLGSQPQTNQPAIMGALHHTFLTLGALTVFSSLVFRTLRPNDGESVSRGQTDV